MFYVSQIENLLLDAAGNLKVSDFGLSAISEQVKVISYNNLKHYRSYCPCVVFILMAFNIYIAILNYFNPNRLMDYYILHVGHQTMLLLR